ncbi:DUF6503 family protein [Lacinutrix sp. Bg11-31]|uniref:DUF6503 family protein n=1 Tax=Lacinutrix sp. Bg11-31 TaxID=2057808 RepID=UPI000C30997F|nr:DUF6503 family protein [Lacinutrix sp. Bg11-31]AUC83577.1 hypothetical protein CW733_16165 [Lacinutrix sp. Bg11-31]
MSILKTVSVLLFAFVFFSCNNKNNTTTDSLEETVSTSENDKLTKSQIILNETIAAHGGDLYNSAHYSFVFRDKIYQFKNDGNNYEYRKNYNKDESTINDILTNENFKRIINGKPVELSEKEITSGTGSINSVIYFATLPYKLSDKAVNSKYIESTIIKGKSYDAIEITFNKEGGGEDHDDEFYYWINKDTKKIGYLAYSYKVNKGGVRFRSAYNTRVIDSITFQDYINYKAEVETPLKDLPALYEAGKLIELSKIETENIINLNKN